MAHDNRSKDSQEVEKEKEIERLAHETGRLIREADPETKQELKDVVSAIIREESSAESQKEASGRRRLRPLNPLALGILFSVVGGGFLFLLPPVGMVLLVVGLAGVVWGVIRAVFVKR